MSRVRSTDGVELAAYDLGGSGPPLVLAHATGFCGEVWRPVARRLGGSFECTALDFRAHGRSGRPADGDLSWRGVGDDVGAVVDAGGLSGGVGAGHSMGGAALLLAELARPGTFRALWLYEPIVIPEDMTALLAASEANPLAETAARRREHFASRAEARANFAAKPPMSSFDPEALEGYLDGGFAELADGTVRLRCRPADEAELYRMGPRHDAAGRLGEITCPVTVVRGRVEPGPPTFAPAVAAGVADGRLEEHPELGHFGPMEDPDGMAASIVAALA